MDPLIRGVESFPLILMRPPSCSNYDDSSLKTGSLSINSVLLPTSDFAPTKSVQIQAKGKGVLSAPCQPREVEIPIFSTVTGRPVYISLRPNKYSGTSKLVDGEDASETALAITTYRFGPCRDPVVQIFAAKGDVLDDFKMVGKNVLTRTIVFESRRWGKFEWRYGGRCDRAQNAASSLLILNKIDSVGGRMTKRTKIAQLIRSDSTRTPGTRPLSAGNGGKLEMNLTDEQGNIELDEVTVIVTCLVMLKKEVDTCKAAQIMAMTAGTIGT